MSKGNRTRRREAGLLPAPVRCTAHNRHGEPCKKFAVNGATVCNKHGGSAPQVRRAAENRLASNADVFMKELIKIATSADSEAVRLAAVRNGLDRLGIGNKQEITLTLKPWEVDLEGLLVDTGDDPEPAVVRGELVASPTPRALPVGRDFKTDDDEPPLPSVADDPPRYGRGDRFR